MENRIQFRLVGNSQYSQKVMDLSLKKIIGELEVTFPISSGFYKGDELYAFLSIENNSNSFRIFKSGKSVGYLHIHPYRNLAHINLLGEGPFQFSIDGLPNSNWSIRQGKKHLEKFGSQLTAYLLEPKERELVIACGLFINAKVKSDMSMALLGAFLFIMMVLFIW
ncbi:hypothetical protein MM239_19375 [Belliella sp. DSM 111904]|uniref:Uncharacterized protein n=1 Tax=Belliella filtrata TaxID=2923435 RepID=A0ABS9V572_9BACT|nr:hypothetical protein [Belliella filtrata]MCH7411557.1 hypothetical protein [Belliella filtrata]